MAPTASALQTSVVGPELPPVSKPVVAYAAWNDLLHKALDGDRASAAQIGQMCAHGANAPRDIGEAIRWLSRAADLGSTEAQRELGLLLIRGEGANKDPDQAALLLRQAAESDDAEAEAALGVMYAYGDGVPQDWALALDWSRKAAEQGNHWA